MRKLVGEGGSVQKRLYDVGWPDETKDADLWITTWEKDRRIHQEGILREVEHVKTDRSKTEKQDVSLFERFVAEGNGRADHPAKAGAM